MAAEAAATLIGEVRDRLATRPPHARPRLLVYGESLGAHGTEAAFGDLADLLAGTDGALLVGPPHINPIWRRLVREPGTGQSGVAPGVPGRHHGGVRPARW